jgi:hypothetical protein
MDSDSKRLTKNYPSNISQGIRGNMGTSRKILRKAISVHNERELVFSRSLTIPANFVLTRRERAEYRTGNRGGLPSAF